MTHQNPLPPSAQPRRDFLKTSVALTAASALPGFAIAQTKPLRIGYITALSGPRAPFGVADQWHLAKVRELLKNGLEVGGKRVPVEILLRDNQSDPNRSVQVASELVLREKVDLMLVEDGDASTPAGQLCDVHGIPMISTMSPWQAFLFARNGKVSKGFPFSFHFFWGADDVVKTFTALWDSVKTTQSVGTLYIDNPPGAAFADPLMGMPPALRKAGYRESTGGFFKVATDDFSNPIATFKKANADIVSGFMYESHFATFWKQAQQQGFKPEVCTVAAAFLFPSALKGLGAAGNGMSTEVWWTPSFPYRSSLTGQSAADFAAEWEKGTGNQWTQPLGYAHALWEVGLHALKTAGDPFDRKAVRDAIQATSIDTIVGKVDFKNSPIKSVAKTALAGGQWRRTAAGAKHPFELVVVNNTLAPAIPLGGKLERLSQIQ
ncbi:MAG: branched-chain amino acid ABC transporter substrate-binding protein [Burkholderiales bacterium RIFCSPLOWO2_12_67_14]|nr:MAG: branched-chain amino acid ABC transporter substrate-binding protein [Burkholderiales bacterium RIFCSPLOWO2_02_FULL_67_64]OGB39137.1 MAG: branched-chain amino acid ABC transporter substrate-binding protein [Burkholderiales bacterium RIFCSPLOWO2_12_67_14]OGB44181.1 MAG: branched-chain amino acid ABC transporter substrate-binding protein [Burkholderiales bacterium RIFCSPHIGHO2_12_FULL_67_38]